MNELYRLGQKYKFQTKKGLFFTGIVTVETSENIKIENQQEGEIILLKEHIEIARPVLNRTEPENETQRKH